MWASGAFVLVDAAIILLVRWAEKHTLAFIQLQHNQCHGLFAVYFTAIMFELCSHKVDPLIR